MPQATFWVDSMNVVFWIHGQSRNYKPFVSHRVGEIHEKSNPNQWRYVPTKQNPADHGTRGLTVSHLADAEMWWNGPSFLVLPEGDWPERRSSTPVGVWTEVKAERKQIMQADEESEQIQRAEPNCSTFAIIEEKNWRLNPARFSKWYRVSSNGQLEFGQSLVRVRSGSSGLSRTVEFLTNNESREN